MSSLILNDLRDIENKSYLELGVGNNHNFEQIRCLSKMSVDINGNGIYRGTTDAFFASIPESEKWDIVFIDANHDYDFVLADFNHSVRHCNKWVAIHDCIPPSKRFTAPHFCSDSYRLLYYLLTSTSYGIYPMSENMGLTFVRMPAEPINPPKRFRSTSYETFTKFMSSARIYAPPELLKILNGGGQE